VAAFLAEMDERDQFKLLACDFVCRSYSDEFRRPTRREIDDVTGFLEGLSTGGSSDLDGAFRAAAAAAGSGAAGRAVRVVYVGDGVATSGAMRPDALVERIATHMAALPGVRIDVVGVGADVDRLALDEIARRFNGAARYVTSGGDEARAALEIVAAQYVAALSAPEVEVVSPASSGPVRAASAVVPTDTVLLADRMAVPPGTGGAGGAGGTPGALGPLYGPRGKAALPPPAPLAAPRSLPLGARIAAEDVFPRRLPTVQEGDELLVVGRFEGEGEAEIVLRGMVGDAAWMKRWPVTLRAEATKGNAFLPALWGRAKVDALTLADPAANKDEIVRVSFDTSVMSRYTSFLVLENERMYREFKVARKTDRDLWTGDEAPALDATETPASAPDDASGKRADEGGDDRSKAGEKAEEKPPAGATPAAGTGAPATAALPGIVGGLEAKGGKAGGAPSITARLGAAGDGDRGGAGKSGAAPSGTESTAGSLEEGARTRRKGTPARSGKMAMGSDADEHETGGADETDDLIDAGHKDDGKAAKDAPPVSAVAPTTPVGASGPGPAHATTTKHAPAGPMKVPAEPAPVTTPAGGGAGGMVAPPASDKEPEALKADKSRYAPPPPAAPKPEPPPKKPSKDAPADAKAKKRVLIEADKIEIVEASKPGFVRVPVKVATIAGAPVRADAAAPAAAVAALRAKVDAGPDVRANREALLKRLVRLGRYDEARAEAEKWLALDAESPAPLEWLGDLALQAGDLPRAVRLYDSLAELTPSVAKLHERLARMHAAKGDAGAACAHRRAAIEVAGDAAKTAAAALELARCERSLGHEAEATVAAKAGLASLSRASVHAPAPVPVPVLAAVPSASGWVRLAGYTSGGMAPSPLPAVPAPLAAPAVTYAPAIQRALEKFLADKPGAAAPAKPRLPGGELVAELRWDSPADLDVALVPPKGDRLGALKELRGIAVRDSLGGADGPERLAARELGTGTYLLVVSAAGGPVPAAVSGTLRVKARGATRTLAFTIPAGKVAAEVASVSAKIVYTFPGYGDALE
jgi:tetratricopeptide (TPR) repeat protein